MSAEINGRRLRELRVARALSQEDLAARAGVAASTIVNLEQGKRGAQYVTLRKLAGALGIDPEELVRKEE